MARALAAGAVVLMRVAPLGLSSRLLLLLRLWSRRTPRLLSELMAEVAALGLVRFWVYLLVMCELTTFMPLATSRKDCCRLTFLSSNP